MNVVPLDTLKSLFTYCPETGIFRWVDQDGPGWRKPGHVAGHLHHGYVKLSIPGISRNFPAHRAAWIMTYGREPDDFLDHVNGDKSDNRISNLRECSHAENMQNKRVYRSNTTGLPGVSPIGDKWRSSISVSRKRVHLGCYRTKEDAYAAYLAAKERLHVFAPLGCNLPVLEKVLV